MPNELLIETIVNTIRDTITSLPPGEILTSAEAFKFAEKIVRQDAIKRGLDVTSAEFRRHAHNIYQQSYSSSRKLVAAQLIGMTFQQAVEITEAAVRRFLNLKDLEIVPRPTLAYSGECERHDVWNLLSNSFHAMKVAEGFRDTLSVEDLLLLQGLRRSEQLLLMISQSDVSLEDVKSKPYDGSVCEQAWARKSTIVADPT